VLGSPRWTLARRRDAVGCSGRRWSFVDAVSGGGGGTETFTAAGTSLAAGPTRHGGVVCDAIPGGHAPSNSSFLRRLKICEDAGVPLRGPRLEAPDAIFAVQYLLWLP